MPGLPTFVAALTVAALAFSPLTATITAPDEDGATPTPTSAVPSAPAGALLGDTPTLEAATAPDWAVQWPAASAPTGTQSFATLVLQPSTNAASFVLQRYVDGRWQQYIAYNVSAHTSIYNVQFRLDTATLGKNTYRFQRTTPTPVADSAPFVFSVDAPAARAAPGAAATSVSISNPPNVVVVGKKVTLTGRVSGGSRALAVRFNTGTGWVKVASGRSATDGRYLLVVPTDWYGRHRLRVVASATAKYKAGTSDNRVVTVKPGYAPRGTASSWSPIVSGARWNPCHVIDIKTNLRGAPAGSLRSVRQAIRRIHAATGLRFRMAGSTTKVPFSRNGSRTQFETGALIIAWTTPSKVSSLQGRVLGVGGSGYTRRVVNGQTVKEYVYGGVALDSTNNRLLRRGFGAGPTDGSLLMHELSHTIGLSHVNARAQIMYPSLSNTALARFGAGDLTGLRKVGAARGCM